MHLRKGWLYLLPLSGLLLCGGASCQSVSDYSALEGNWHIVGSNPDVHLTHEGAFIAIAVGVKGNTVYATGEDGFLCANGGNSWGGLVATSQIASDGSFVLSNRYPDDPIRYTIRGMVPSAGASVWQGSYTLANATSNPCSFSQSGNFEATAYPSLDGTYTGTLKENGQGGGIGVVLTVSQSRPTFVPLGIEKNPHLQIPLSGRITVTGSPCFNSGTSTPGLGNDISGDGFGMAFAMNDGSEVIIQGFLDNEDEPKLQLVTLTAKTGPCANSRSSGTLTLQK